MTFSPFFFVTNIVISQILYWQKLCMSICKPVLLTKPCIVTYMYMPCNLVLTAMNVFMLSWTFHFFEIQGFIISVTILNFIILTFVDLDFLFTFNYTNFFQFSTLKSSQFLDLVPPRLIIQLGQEGVGVKQEKAKELNSYLTRGLLEPLRFFPTT